jgi:ATP-dependent Clp protease ATP-binding subunit ClpC
MRRFGTIIVEEPNEEQTKRILIGIKHRLENFHDCTITDDAIDAAINLSKRYRPDKYFPDKAIDCIDIACAKCQWLSRENNKKPSIKSDDIAQVISKQCFIPLEVIMWDSYERIKKTEQTLYDKIVGQQDAVKSVCRILKNAYSGIRNPDKPIGIMVFGGPSGTGKTYISKQLASVMFGTDASFIRLDMTEFSEPHSVSRIVGSPPGYVGFKDTDVIVDRIKRRPYCVILLDEIEKAHPTVMKLFLQVMGDGFITSASGEKIDCRNAVIIMTGNFGMNTSFKPSMGFNSTLEVSQTENEKKRMVSFCEKMFGVEFINRVDDFIPFESLSDDNLTKIAYMRLQEFTKRLNNVKAVIEFSNDVPSKLVELSKKEHGINAMAMERMIVKYVEPCIADALLNISDKSSKHTIYVVVENGSFATKDSNDSNDSNDSKE